MRVFEAKAYGLHETRNPLFPVLTPSRRLWPMILAIVVLCLLVVGIWALAFGPYFRFQKIEVNGAVTLSPTEISAVVKQDLQRKKWLLLSNGQRWFYTQEGSEAMLMSSFPLESVNIVTHGNVIEITIVEDIFLVGLKINDQTLVLNTEGRVIESPANLPAEAPFIRDKTNSPRQVGDQVFAENTIAGVIEFTDGLRRAHIQPQEFVSDDPGLTWFTVTSDQDYVILFDASRDIAEQLQLLETILDEFLTTQDTMPSYIDVRFGSRVYVR